MTSPKKVTIFDYGMGNMFSISHGLEHLGAEVVITSNPEDIDKAEMLVLPGVGAFAQAMKNLNEISAVDELKKYLKSDRKFLGVCLGFQLLFEKSSEFGDCEGLGIFPGTIEKIPSLDSSENRLKVPHIGWERVHTTSETGIMGTIEKDQNCFYFVHSFYSAPLADEIISSYSFYEDFKFCSSIESGNIMACQFHPEKSGKVGLKLLENWLNK
jgi:glutamine amidotransferase